MIERERERNDNMKKYTLCNDETLQVDLYLNGNIWQKDYPLPIDYTKAKNGRSMVDLIEMVHRLVPFSNKAIIQIIVVGKGDETKETWDWSKLTETSYLLTCSEIKALQIASYVGINIVPQLEKKEKPRPRSSANNFLPLLVKEPWRPDEPTGRYPQRWWTLLITDPKTGKRIPNPRLPSKTIGPAFSLPRLGVGNYLHEKQFNKNATPEKYYEQFNDQVRSILRVPPDSLSTEELEQVEALLKKIDFDYALLKQEFAKLPSISLWFQKGYDILPDLERGNYMWVYTGIEKNNADERKFSMLKTLVVSDLKEPADSDLYEELESSHYQCAFCSKEAQFANMHMMRMFCSMDCHTTFRRKHNLFTQ